MVIGGRENLCGSKIVYLPFRMIKSPFKSRQLHAEEEWKMLKSSQKEINGKTTSSALDDPSITEGTLKNLCSHGKCFPDWEKFRVFLSHSLTTWKHLREFP